MNEQSKTQKTIFASIPPADYATLKQLASANCMSLKAMLVKLIREAEQTTSTTSRRREAA